MCDSVKSTQTIQWVDQAGDKTDDIVIPTGVVDPAPEDKFTALVRWSTRNYCDQDDQPADLKVEQGEFVQRWDDLVPK